MLDDVHKRFPVVAGAVIVVAAISNIYLPVVEELAADTEHDVVNAFALLQRLLHMLALQPFPDCLRLVLVFLGGDGMISILIVSLPSAYSIGVNSPPNIYLSLD